MTFAPGRHFAQRKFFIDRQGQQLRQRPGGGADLHPGFQRGARLLPQIANAPPTLQIVKQGLNAPAPSIQLDNRRG